MMMALTRGMAKLRLQRALALWQRRKDEEAIQVGLSAAEHLDSAKIVVAQWYGVKGNWTAAIPLLESAAANGRWEAKQVLAACYFFGDGVARDVERSHEIAADAAESGSLDCQIELARHYSVGEAANRTSSLPGNTRRWLRQTAGLTCWLT